MNLFDSIEQQARTRPLAAAIIDGDVAMTFGELAAASIRAAALLARQGIAPGAVVGLATMSSWLHVVLTLALARLGAISLSMPTTAAPAEQRPQVARDFGVRAVLAEGAEAGFDPAPVIVIDALALRAAARSGETAPQSVAADERAWRICLTSGTTGPRKGIVMCHAQFTRVSALRASSLKVQGGSRFLSRLGLVTSAVLKRTLAHLFAGGTVVAHYGELVPLFDTIDALAVTHLYASPAVVHNWLAHYPAGRAPFARVAHFAVGGGRLPPALAEQAMARLTPNIHVSYGSTETGVIASADPQTLRRAPDSVGRVLPWVTVEIVDDAERPLPAGETGRVRVRGDEVASGYYGGQEAGGTGKNFRDGWFYSGDLGRLTPEGLLYVEGRGDDVINLGGPKVNARVIEDALSLHAGVAEAAVFAVTMPEGTGVVAAVVPRGPFDETELQRHLRSRGITRELRIVAVASLPRNDMGKVLKHELAGRLRVRRSEAT